MKKTIIAFAALASFAGLASAQSSVTLSGRVTTSVGKDINSLDTRLLGKEWSGFVFSGVEDLGNGMSAGFKINPRVNVVSGTSGGKQDVGFGEKLVFLQGAFGKISLGTVDKPIYTAAGFADVNAFSIGSNSIITAGTGYMPAGTAWESDGGRQDRGVRYEYNANGLYAGVSLSDKNPASLAAADNNGTAYAAGGAMPVSVGVGFNAMGFKVGIGHDRGRAKAANQQNWSLVSVGYEMPIGTLALGYGMGKEADGDQRRSGIVGLKGNIGVTNVMLTYGQVRVKPVGGVETKNLERVALGAKYNLSKRTNVFANAAYDKAIKDAKGPDANKNAAGYEIGVTHTF